MAIETKTGPAPAEGLQSSLPPAFAAGLTPSLLERLSETVDRGVQHLLSLQAGEGNWMGELEADTTLESDYIFYLHVLGKADDPRIAKLATYIRRRQMDDGGGGIY